MACDTSRCKKVWATQVVLEDSDASEEPDPDMEIVEQVKKKNAKKAKTFDEIEFLDLTNIVPVADSRFTAKYEASQADIRRNLARLEEVKAMLNATTPEPAEPGETWPFLQFSASPEEKINKRCNSLE